MTEKNELNKKILELAGFRHVEPKYCESCGRQEPPYWMKEGVGRRLDDSEVLNFPKSLDALFKWIVTDLGEEKKREVFNEWLYLMDVNRDEAPALALCLAIEKRSGIKISGCIYLAKEMDCDLCSTYCIYRRGKGNK